MDGVHFVLDVGLYLDHCGLFLFGVGVLLFRDGLRCVIGWIGRVITSGTGASQ